MGQNSDFPKEVQSLMKEVDETLQKLTSLSVDEKKDKLEDILKMISHYVGLTEEMESRRTAVYNLGLQILAISVAALAFLGGRSVNDSSTFALLPTLLATVVALVLVFFVASLVIGVLYHCQSAFRYPFLKFKEYSNRWKWFYHANAEIQKISARPVFATKKHAATTIPYLEGLKSLVSKYTVETLDTELKDGIIQLYLLQVHNYYKNRFFLQLVCIWKFAFWIVALVFIILLSECLYNNV